MAIIHHWNNTTCSFTWLRSKGRTYLQQGRNVKMKLKSWLTSRGHVILHNYSSFVVKLRHLKVKVQWLLRIQLETIYVKHVYYLTTYSSKSTGLIIFMKYQDKCLYGWAKVNNNSKTFFVYVAFLVN